MKSPAHSAVAVNRRIARLDKLLAAARAERDVLRGARELQCGCGVEHAIAELELLVTQYYHRPHGCSGGDYYTDAGWQFQCPDEPKIRTWIRFDDWRVPYEQRNDAAVAAQPAFEGMYRSLFKSRRDVQQDYEDGIAYFKLALHSDHDRARLELPLMPAQAAGQIVLRKTLAS